ncbi:hypothetical protein R1sor_027302 [Riccia sorocarpa]|uniref:Reverse transcriptase domain-containing protein n=1 Tax=Riccia sorocarpa TaxID=122646 RepID=A0ABD3GFY9_9MARC
MDAESLQDTNFRDRVKQEWAEGWSLSPVPTIAWTLAWGRVQNLYKERRDERQKQMSKLQTLKDKVEEIRIRLAEQGRRNNGREREEHTNDLEEYKKYEAEVRELEHSAGEAARRRSRACWLQRGDTPTKYYFAILRAKQAASRMTTLITNEEEEITDEDRILEEIHTFYNNLYTREELPSNHLEEETATLATLDKKLDGEDNLKLQLIPDEEEIRTIVKNMPKDKSPGIDGITAEVLQECWEWIEPGYQALILHFWNTGSLSERDVLAALIPKLVDEEQTGFVEGRNIADNILCLHLSRELAEATEQPSLFCKLDFVKAFDRVDHGYLWRTLQAMNFNNHTLMLLQGLVSHGRSKIHIHGRYTGSIALGRGVRHGCSISPLLFALSTQPLMQLLRSEERAGNLIGVNIPGGRPLLHRLFADDSGVSITATEANFSNLTSTIARFEGFSGARLNLAKSAIIPLALPNVPQWLPATGCKIVSPGEHIVYLGCKAGPSFEEEDHARDIANKLVRKLAHWSHKFLTWPGRVVILRHILKAIPIYSFLSIGLSEEGYKHLEAVCRDFIWGTNRDGKAKLALLAWEQITQCRTQGGLDLHTFKQTSQALKMKFIARLLDGSRSEWAQMLKFFIKAEMQRRAHGNDCRTWTAEEGLILLPSFTCYSYNARVIHAWAKKMNIIVLAELRSNSATWWDLIDLSHRKGVNVTELQRQELTRFQDWLAKVDQGPPELHKSPSWKWKSTNQTWTGWEQHTGFWRKLLFTQPRPHKLDVYWEIQGHGISWSQRWKFLWQSKLALRNQLWVWKLLRQALFTGERAWKCRVTEGICQRCGQGRETVIHLFWTCREAEKTWSKLRTLLSRIGHSASLQPTLIGSFDAALSGLNVSQAFIQLLISTTSAIWKDRNSQVFRNRRSRTPVLQILKLTQQEIDARLDPRVNDENWRKGQEASLTARNWLQWWIENANERRNDNNRIQLPTHDESIQTGEN